MSLQKNDEKTQNVIIAPPDRTLVIATIFLIVIGIMSIFSATSAKAIAENHHPIYYLAKQMSWLVFGVFACWFFTKLDYRKLRPLALPFAFFVIFLLALTAFTPLGVSVNGAKRWLYLGVQFQPSEFSKLAIILCMADVFAKDTKLLDSSKFVYYFVFILTLGLVITQPNLSMTILLCLCAAAMYYCAGGSLALLGAGAALGLPAIFFFMMHGYQKQRLIVWLDPTKDPSNTGYNIIQSLVAFVGGSFFGVGYGNSRQKLSWLPEGHTDFIFSIIAEEFGFLGCLFIIGLFIVFLRRGFITASRCPDKFGKLLAFGITFSITAQAFINMSVASGFLPASGIPLPFISYGGSSLFISLCMVGILLSISKKRVQKINSPRLGYGTTY